MSRIKQGTNYTVQTGDTLPRISILAYGVASNSGLIKNANRYRFKVTGDDEVQPGEVLRIPIDPLSEFLRR